MYQLLLEVRDQTISLSEVRFMTLTMCLDSNSLSSLTAQRSDI